MTESKPMDHLDRLSTATTIPEITSISSTCTSNLSTMPPQTMQTQLIQQTTPTVSTTREIPTMYLLDQDQGNSININTIASTDDPDLSVGVELIPCPICNRTFNPNTLQKHVGICEKMATKKRNVFDSSRQRREGTELATYPLPKNFGLPTGNNTSNAMTNSIIRSDRGQSPKPHKIDSPILARKKSQDEFVRTTSRTSMRKRSNSASNTSRVSTTPANTHVNIPGINNESQTNSMTHPITFTRDRMRSSERSLTKRIQPPPAEQCPHCERCFGIKAYDRHVEWCKEKALQAAIKQNSRNDQSIAKERLEARTKYRAPCLKTKRSINRDKYSGFTPDENDPATDSPKLSNSKNLMSLSMTSSITSDSGIPCNYDPFLSAKRQLEELCLPISPTDTLTRNVTASESTPSTPCINATLPSKMTTSLTLNISTSQSSPLTQNNSHNRLNNALTSTPSCKTPISSNFRRTSSLRGSRRSPMLSSRPLFAQKQRPTIQRGLSDEGPISTNFLKPEEYDEMPVRSVCVNDFAISNSPRVVRRDTSSSNRKPNVTAKTSQEIATTNMPLINATNKTEKSIKKDNSSDERLTDHSKHFSKTDSLAVFLKYENELEQLPITTTESINNQQSSKTCNSIVPQVSDFESPVITKELKDKSNNLSKQNSTKSMKQISLDEEETEEQKPKSSNLGTLLPTPVSQPQNLLDLPKQDSFSNTNFTKNSTLHLEPISKPNKQSTIATSKYKPNCNEVFPNSSKELPPMINLNAIFGTCKPTETSTVLNKETQNLSYNEYIDPKLINKCDNLPINLNKYFTHKTTDSNSSDSEPHLDISSHPTDISTTSTDTATIPVFQQSKLPQHSKYNESFVKLHSVYANETRPINDHSTGSCNISEGRNVLKRKMRLGRNQFLYDASPEPEFYTTNDNFNRLSTRSNNQQPNQKSPSITPTSQLQTQTSHQHSTTRQRPPPLPLPSPLANIPQIPTFDNFNFEEFLSSFEHDDEQFPLFKDCREFLLNRTSSKLRSTLTSNSNKGSVNDNKHHSRQSPITPTHFQFPNVHINNSTYQTSAASPSSSHSSFFLRSRNNCNIIDREPGQNASDNGRNSPEFNKSHTVCDEPSNFNDDHKKREIFISIETEQNDLERSPISPNSLRNMVGNPQTMVEVEIDATDNKFSRISDDEPMPRTPSPFNALAREDLPNVQLNNAKNLIQKMQDDFRQMSEEVGENLRQAVKTCSSHRNSATGTPRSDLNTEATTTTPETTKTIPSGDAGMESDDMSSLDGYPILAQSSRRGVSSKLSADSAYGSLSRQRTLDTSTHRNSGRAHPSAINMVTNTSLPTTIVTQIHQQQPQPQQQQYQQQLHSKQSQTATPYNKYNSTKIRARQRSGSSSSGSDNSLPPISHNNHNLNLTTCNTAYQQQLSQIYSNNKMNNNCDSPLSSPTTNLSVTNVTTIQRNDPNANHSRSNSISNSNSSLKMSKFCHECGGKFIIENAKFCTDCGIQL